jgi:hypothetical protein
MRALRQTAYMYMFRSLDGENNKIRDYPECPIKYHVHHVSSVHKCQQNNRMGLGNFPELSALPFCKDLSNNTHCQLDLSLWTVPLKTKL